MLPNYLKDWLKKLRLEMPVQSRIQKAFEDDQEI